MFRSNWEGGMVFWLPFEHVFGHRLAQNHTNSDAQNEIWLHLLCCAEHSRHQQHTTKNENNANADLSKWENSFKQKLAKRKFLFISCRIVVGAAEWQNKRADWDAIAAGIFEMKCWTNANLPPVKIVKFVALDQCWIVDIFIRCWRTFHIYSILYISIVTTASSEWPIFIISILFYMSLSLQFGSCPISLFNRFINRWLPLVAYLTCRITIFRKKKKTQIIIIMIDNRYARCQDGMWPKPLLLQNAKTNIITEFELISVWNK